MLSEVRRVCIPIGVWGGFQTGWSSPRSASIAAAIFTIAFSDTPPFQ